MKYIKIFERFDKLEDYPRVGDYAIFDTFYFNKDMNDFAINNIGRIIKISDNVYMNDFNIIVKYDNIPDNLKNNFTYDIDRKYYKKNYSSENLEYFSSNKEDVEVYIQSKKYNL